MRLHPASGKSAVKPVEPCTLVASNKRAREFSCIAPTGFSNFNRAGITFAFLSGLLALSGCVGSNVGSTLDAAALSSEDVNYASNEQNSVTLNQLAQIPIPVRSPVSSRLAQASSKEQALSSTGEPTGVAAAPQLAIQEPTQAASTQLAAASSATAVPASATSEIKVATNTSSDIKMASVEPSSLTANQSITSAGTSSVTTPATAPVIGASTGIATPTPAPAASATPESKKPVGLFGLFFAKKPPNQMAKATVSTNTPTRRASTSDNALPGVKRNSAIFGINDDENQDEPTIEERGSSARVQVASAGGFTRTAVNGLILQTDRVQVDCFKPDLLKVLKTVERRYGKKVMVTSGYRSPTVNRRAGGASNSTHIYCKAADIQVEGVNKWDLAKYLRTLPGRGGVGTYCRTESVHIDVGTQRDWHHPCRRSKKQST